MSTKSPIVYVLTSLLLAGCVASRAQIAQPGPRTVLVELFTSEGCSSCPPADVLLSQINQKRLDANTLIVGISEHVTYWNHDGWSDPFSDDVFTDRQNTYGGRFHLDSVYTPQMVVNGERQAVGSDRNAVLQAIRSISPQTGLKLDIVSAGADGRQLKVTYTVRGQAPGQTADIFAVVTDDLATSKVLRGENSGRTLSHVSVAQSITRVGALEDATDKTVILPLHGPGRSTIGQGRHLILFAQEPRSGKVLVVEARSL
jgi:hypothetical protein